MITRNEFQNCIEEMLRLSATKLPKDVVEALRRSEDLEENQLAKKQIENILKNLKIAEEEGRPICQDTGIPLFFFKMSRKMIPSFPIEEAIRESIKKATEAVPLRPNIVDPLDRKNTGDNTGRGHPIVHMSLSSEETFEIELLLKGAGSENWSRLFMLNPTGSEKIVREKVIQVLKEARGQICPPTIIGVGIGGTADHATFLAKRALLRPLGEKNEDEKLAKLEKKITDSANELGIGPMGLGGRTTALGTRIEKAGCHTASLPLSVNFQCWAARRAKARLQDGELKIEVP